MPSQLAALELTPELKPFQTQPAQMRAGAPGKVGSLRLGFRRSGERSVLHELHRVTPLLVQRALYWDEAMPELPICSIISVGGGMLQGDRANIEITVEEGACAHVTSQGANRIHQMDANYALQQQMVTVASGGYLEYLPDMTIPYRGSRFVSRTDVKVASDATLIYGEIMMSGRKHHRKDERFGFDLLSMQTRLARHDGTSLFTEKFVIEGGDPMLEAGAVMGGYDVFANILCATPPAIATRIQSRFETEYSDPNFMCGLSRLPNQAGLMLRMVGTESHKIRPALRQFWRIVREEARGRTLPDEFLWR